jgi:hypothetical protein
MAANLTTEESVENVAEDLNDISEPTDVENVAEKLSDTTRCADKPEQTSFVAPPAQDQAVVHALTATPHNSEMDLCGSRATLDPRGGRTPKRGQNSGLFGP